MVPKQKSREIQVVQPVSQWLDSPLVKKTDELAPVYRAYMNGGPSTFWAPSEKGFDKPNAAFMINPRVMKTLSPTILNPSVSNFETIARNYITCYGAAEVNALERGQRSGMVLVPILVSNVDEAEKVQAALQQALDGGYLVGKPRQPNQNDSKEKMLLERAQMYTGKMDDTSHKLVGKINEIELQLNMAEAKQYLDMEKANQHLEPSQRKFLKDHAGYFDPYKEKDDSGKLTPLLPCNEFWLDRSMYGVARKPAEFVEAAKPLEAPQEDKEKVRFEAILAKLRELYNKNVERIGENERIPTQDEIEKDVKNKMGGMPGDENIEPIANAVAKEHGWLEQKMILIPVIVGEEQTTVPTRNTSIRPPEINEDELNRAIDVKKKGRAQLESWIMQYAKAEQSIEPVPGHPEARGVFPPFDYRNANLILGALSKIYTGDKAALARREADNALGLYNARMDMEKDSLPGVNYPEWQKSLDFYQYKKNRGLHDLSLAANVVAKRKD